MHSFDPEMGLRNTTCTFFWSDQNPTIKPINIVIQNPEYLISLILTFIFSPTKHFPPQIYFFANVHYYPGQLLWLRKTVQKVQKLSKNVKRNSVNKEILSHWHWVWISTKYYSNMAEQAWISPFSGDKISKKMDLTIVTIQN